MVSAELSILDVKPSLPLSNYKEVHPYHSERFLSGFVSWANFSPSFLDVILFLDYDTGIS